jgi:hypothetical protein
MMGIKNISDYLKNKKHKPEIFDDIFFKKLRNMFDGNILRATGRTTLISEILLDLALSNNMAIGLFDHIMITNPSMKHYRFVFNRIVELTVYLKKVYDINIELFWDMSRPTTFKATFVDTSDFIKYNDLKRKKERIFDKHFFEKMNK